MLKEYFSKLFEDLSGILQLKTIVSLAALLLIFAIFVFISRKSKFNTRMVAYGAFSIAVSFILSYVRVFHMPNGGSVTLASMLPIMIYSFAAGPAAGMAAGVCYGFLQFIQEPFLVHWAQFLLDYPIAFAMLGIVGFFGKKLYVGIVASGFGRLACHFLSGVIFFASYAGEQNVLLYSLIYNSTFLLPDIAVCIAVALLPGMRGLAGKLSAAIGKK